MSVARTEKGLSAILSFFSFFSSPLPSLLFLELFFTFPRIDKINEDRHYASSTLPGGEERRVIVTVALNYVFFSFLRGGTEVAKSRRFGERGCVDTPMAGFAGIASDLRPRR